MSAGSKIILVLLILVLLFFMVLFGRRKLCALRERRLLLSGRGGCGYLRELYLTAFGKQCRVLRDIYLHRDGGAGGSLCLVPMVVVCRGGIFTVEEKHMDGFIENPMRGDWRQFHGDRIVQFQNPCERNAVHIAAIRRLLDARGIKYGSAKGIVVFTGHDYRFKNNFAQVLSAEGSLDYLGGEMRGRIITPEQVDTICRVLKQQNHRIRTHG